jgi:hypothetical protein
MPALSATRVESVQEDALDIGPPVGAVGQKEGEEYGICIVGCDGSSTRIRALLTIHREVKMTRKRVSVHMVFVGIHSVLAILTLIPTGMASKACLLGYEAHCTFTPISTLMLLALAGLHVFLHRRSLAKKPA